MFEHLTHQQFEDYCRQQLSVAELLLVSDHLGECEACRRLVEGAMNGDAAFFALRSELFGGTAEAASAARPVRAHLTAEQTAAYVDRALSGEKLQAVADHLATCEQCDLAVEDLRAFRDEVAPSLESEYQPAPMPAPAQGRWRRMAASLSALFRVSPAPAFGATLAVLLLAVTGWFVWRTGLEGEPRQEVVVATAPWPATAVAAPPAPTSELTSVTPPTEPLALVAQLSDGGGLLTLDRDGKLSGADGLPPAYRSMVKKVVITRQVETSSQLEGLTRPPSSLMGSGKQGREFSVLEPVGNVLMTAQPTFRWSPMEGATGYVVEVYDVKFNPVATSPQLTGDSWAAPQPLARGQVYTWQVKAFRDGQEVTSPRPPAPQARFRILDQPKANELAKARRAYPSSHLLLGLLYAEAGLLKEAERELRLLRRANSDSELARRLLAQVQAVRRRSE